MYIFLSMTEASEEDDAERGTEERFMVSEVTCDTCNTEPEIRNWNPEKVKEWLVSELGLKNEIGEQFMREDISGVELEALTMQEIKQICPGLSFGNAKRITMERDSLKDIKTSNTQRKAGTQLKPERFRKFDTDVGATTVYIRGRGLPQGGCLVDNLMKPVHFFLEDCSKDELILQMEVAQFTCACLNHRTNGTLHIGVGNGKTSDEGKVLGVPRSLKYWQEVVEEAVESFFPPDQIRKVKQCLRPVKIVKVTPEKGGADCSDLCVVEIDVVPENEICEVEVFWAKRLKGGVLRTGRIFHFKGQMPVPLHQDGYKAFYEMIPQLRDLRKKNSAQDKKPQFDVNLRRKVEDLFCRGQSDFSRDLFPILVTSAVPAGITSDEVRSQFGFVKDVPWTAVFDFDQGEDDSSMYRFIEETEQQVVKVLRVEDFDAQAPENCRESGRLDSMLKDLKENKSNTPWIFANGCALREEKPMEFADWKRHRIKGLKEAVRFLQREIPRERAVVVFMLLSEDDVMREAAYEFCTEFNDQWCIISESARAADEWKSWVQSRHIVDSERELEKNCIVGMPWGHLNQTMLQLLDVRRGGTHELISSNGVYVSLKEKLRNDLTDLDILGRNQCENEDIVTDQSKLRKFGKKVEEAFYRGEVVDWWNFYFENHVLTRDCHNKICSQLRDILTGKVDEDERVGRYTIYHEPGAGGTTTAKQLLWDLRSEVRCAIVRKITEETCEQIKRLHTYESGEKPVPLLLLLDNQDDERISDLKAELEEKARQAARQLEHTPPLFYLLLLCKRKSTVPPPKDTERTILQQQLSHREVDWFKAKYKVLETNYKEDKGSDPRHLLSFNIMKENFSEDYIRRTVEEITREISDYNERRLLTYVSLLNSYVVDFEPVPLSSFDSMMIEDEHGVCQWGKSIEGWEKYLSSPLKLLIHQRSRKECGTVIRIINNALSKEVLHTFLEMPSETGEVPCLSDFVIDLLGSSVFRTAYMDSSVTQLLKVIRDGMKRRRRKVNGRYETLFAPLIQEIVDDEKQGVPKAAAVLAKVYELSKDVYVGQQLARIYYLVAKNWDLAEKYAKEITELRPNNSYLLDTLARVYKEQVAEMYTESTQSMNSTEPEHARQVVELAFKAVDVFHKAQELSERENAKTCVNQAGYYGEITVVVQLLDYLSNVNGLHEAGQLHDVLVNDASPVIKKLQMHWGGPLIKKLRSLQEGAKRALTRIEDEFLQLRDNVSDDYRKSLNTVGKECLIKLKENLECYYGEESNEVPAGLDEYESCKYRRRRIFRLAGSGFRGIFEMRRKEDGEAQLSVIKRLASKNLGTKFKDAFDLQTLISVNITLCSTGRPSQGETSHSEMANLSYDLLQEQNAEGISLEPYLFAVMFNWPRRRMDFRPKLSVNRFPETIRKWKDAYCRKYPRQTGESTPYRKKDTTLFFLGNGEDMQAFAFERELRDQTRSTGTHFWNSNVVIQRLERWEGVLITDGTEVKLTVEQNGNKFALYLPTSFPIVNRRWWNKRVFCVVGFTWAGPKAFDIDPDDKSSRPNRPTLDQSVPAPSHRQRVQRPAVTVDYERRLHLHAEFTRQLEDVNKQLADIQRKPKRQRQQREVCKTGHLVHEYLYLWRSYIYGDPSTSERCTFTFCIIVTFMRSI